jgi:nucleoside-diphosphate-sugar epimerase
MRILITGKNSYIGNSVKAWLNEKEPSFIVDEVSVRNIDLNTLSFKNYDVIFHVAGIAHITSNKKMIPEYFKINRDLAIEVAKKAKEEGVKQFIFTSTMAIYGDDRPIGDFRPIYTDKPSPTNTYGQSKLNADLAIQKLQDNYFDVIILRLPMVYGKNSKGNFLRLVEISKKSNIFPKLKNFRSVLHIKNLSELVRLTIIYRLKGVLYPQDKNYFDTTKFISLIRLGKNKKTLFVPFLSTFLTIIGFLIKPINKIYGNKYYMNANSTITNINYQLFSIEDVIQEIKDI